MSLCGDGAVCPRRRPTIMFLLEGFSDRARYLLGFKMHHQKNAAPCSCPSRSFFACHRDRAMFVVEHDRARGPSASGQQACVLTFDEPQRAFLFHTNSNSTGLRSCEAITTSCTCALHLHRLCALHLHRLFHLRHESYRDCIICSYDMHIHVICVLTF